MKCECLNFDSINLNEIAIKVILKFEYQAIKAEYQINLNFNYNSLFLNLNVWILMKWNEMKLLKFEYQSIRSEYQFNLNLNSMQLNLITLNTFLKIWMFEFWSNSNKLNC